MKSKMMQLFHESVNKTSTEVKEKVLRERESSLTLSHYKVFKIQRVFGCGTSCRFSANKRDQTQK